MQPAPLDGVQRQRQRQREIERETEIWSSTCICTFRRYLFFAFVLAFSFVLCLYLFGKGSVFFMPLLWCIKSQIREPAETQIQTYTYWMCWDRWRRSVALTETDLAHKSYQNLFVKLQLEVGEVFLCCDFFFFAFCQPFDMHCMWPGGRVCVGLASCDWGAALLDLCSLFESPTSENRVFVVDDELPVKNCISTSLKRQLNRNACGICCYLFPSACCHYSPPPRSPARLPRTIISTLYNFLPLCNGLNACILNNSPFWPTRTWLNVNLHLPLTTPFLNANCILKSDFNNFSKCLWAVCDKKNRRKVCIARRSPYPALPVSLYGLAKSAMLR